MKTTIDIISSLIGILSRAHVELTPAEGQVVFEAGALVKDLMGQEPTGYVLIGPEGMPTFPEPYTTLDELVCATARYMLRFQHQGYYRDMRMVEQPLEWVADGMSVQKVPTVMTSTAAYTKYVNDNLERIGRDGWVPMCYEEFLDSEECANEMYREEVSRPTATEPDGWTFVGNAAVDAGMLMVTDPCYINSEWKKDGTERPMIAPGYRHTDGTILFYPGHGNAPAEGAIPFEHYEAIVEKYGKTVNAMNAEGLLTKLPKPPASGEFSYTGACEATDDNNDLQGGQLNFKMGHAGAGVVFRTGYGDGCYPVYLRYVNDGDTRVAEARIVFIDESELEPAYVIWESGCIEEFECTEDAQHEMMAMQSRGARGELVNDLSEAITYLGTRLDIPLLPTNLTGDFRQEIREFAGRYPVAWGADRKEDNTRAVLLKAEDAAKFRLVLYQLTEGTLGVDDHKGPWTREILPTCGLSELPQLLRRHLTRVGVLEAKVAEQAAEIARLKSGS